MKDFLSAWQFDTKGKVIDSECAELDLSAEMGSKTARYFRWNVRILPFFGNAFLPIKIKVTWRFLFQGILSHISPVGGQRQFSCRCSVDESSAKPYSL